MNRTTFALLLALSPFCIYKAKAENLEKLKATETLPIYIMNEGPGLDFNNTGINLFTEAYPGPNPAYAARIPSEPTPSKVQDLTAAQLAGNIVQFPPLGKPLSPGWPKPLGQCLTKASSSTGSQSTFVVTISGSLQAPKCIIEIKDTP